MIDNNNYNICDDIFVKIKPWECNLCNNKIINHPNYCSKCHTFSDNYNIINEADNRKKINKIDKIVNVFNKKRKILLPVLSCKNEEDFYYNIDILYEYYNKKKISGIFIVSTFVDIETITNIYNETKKKYTDLWVGVNLIGENIFKVYNFIKLNNPDGIWIDNSYLFDINKLGFAELILNQFEKYNWNGLYFGGYMFKYQINCNTYDNKLIKILNQYLDILTTSGDGTNIEISDEKLNYISNESVQIPIAIASGVNNNNLEKHIEKCNIIIIRSSIIDSNENIDKEKLDEICNKIELII
jgi:hypothetical protein